jgi:hypothetical protein
MHGNYCIKKAYLLLSRLTIFQSVASEVPVENISSISGTGTLQGNFSIKKAYLYRTPTLFKKALDPQ